MAARGRTATRRIITAGQAERAQVSPAVTTAGLILGLVGMQATSMATAIREGVRPRAWILEGVRQLQAELDRLEADLEADNV